MKTVIYKADTRGYADHGWLKSYHTFSFSNYHNAKRMNFGKLRVFNDDVVAPDMGFGTHSHKNMEIISIPLKGALSHRDSMGNERAIAVGEVQVMSAGTGVSHSEFNASQTNEINFLQLWIIPEHVNVVPHYEQRMFDVTQQKNELQTIVAPKDKLQGNALPINQQAYIYRANLDALCSKRLAVKNSNNGFYVFVVSGEIEVNGITLVSRDALGVYDTENLSVNAIKLTSLIIIEVPMT